MLQTASAASNVQCPANTEETSKEFALVVIQKAVAPVDGLTQGLLSFRQIERTTG